MIANRPDWTLSRQRQWGVPMAFFVHRETGALHPRTPELIEQVAKLIESATHEAGAAPGTDRWKLVTDELTGTLNRRAFLGMATRTHSLSQRFGRRYSVIMIDSDSLKKINDVHGHEAGDELLKTMVLKTQEELRQSDLLSRYGGDEFVVLLPDTDSEGARLTAERIRGRIAGMPLKTPNGTTVEESMISASIGVATYPDNGSEFDRVFEAADLAMYTSKTTGKNKVTLAQPGSPRVV